MNDHIAFIVTVQQSKKRLSLYCWTLKVKVLWTFETLKHMQHFISLYGVTSQDICICNSNTERTSNLALSPSFPKSKLEEIHEQLWSTCTHIRINTNLNFEFKEAKVHIGQWYHLRWRRNFEFVVHTSCLETKIFLHTSDKTPWKHTTC